MKKVTQFFTLLLVVFLSFTFLKSNAMEKKKVEKVTVLMYSMQSTLATMAQDAGNIPDELVKKAEELGLEITGPQIWQYRNVDGNPTSTFHLDICIPVDMVNGDAGKFKFEVLPAISCISEIHKGSWSKLSDTYSRLMGEMTRKSIFPTNTSREIYHVCDFENEKNCVTEIQMVINE